MHAYQITYKMYTYFYYGRNLRMKITQFQESFFFRCFLVALLLVPGVTVQIWAVIPQKMCSPLGWSPEQLYHKNKKHTNFYYGPRPQKTPKKIWDQFDQIWTFKNGHFKTQICIYVIFSKLLDFNVLQLKMTVSMSRF